MSAEEEETERDHVLVSVVTVFPQSVRLAITAPGDVRIIRSELTTKGRPS